MREISESDSPLFQSINSSMGVVMPACAVRAPPAFAAAAPRSCSSTALVSPAFAAHAVVSPLHFNSWSNLVRLQGPTGRRRVKGGVSGPGEDVRPVSEVGGRGECSARLQVHFPGGQPGKGKFLAHLPSTQIFLTPDSRHLDVDRAAGTQAINGLEQRCVKPHGRGFGCKRLTP